MLGRGILLLVFVPLVELILLHQLVQSWGLAETILLVLVTGVVGVGLARQQGLKAWKAVHTQLASGQSPSAEIMDGVMILIAGAFLMTPGLLTDTVGFSLLIPLVRRLLRTKLVAWFKHRTVTTFRTQFPNAEFGVPGETADTDEDEPVVRVVDPEAPSP
ncbi:MAG TPA: hypothetical protein DCG12_06015 [Planctomycetaceae bacterium]|nr:hypothetical protein [Planctomycetaceae bacterium]